MITLTRTVKIKVLTLSAAAFGFCLLLSPSPASAQAVDVTDGEDTTIASTTTAVQPMEFDLGPSVIPQAVVEPLPTAYQAASAGDQRHTTVQRQATVLSQQTSTPNLAPTYFGNITGGGVPMTQFTGFVGPAGGSAEMIYGDEGTDGPPPYFGYTEANSIQAGL